MKTNDRTRLGADASADTFWRAVTRPFRRVPEHISSKNRLAFSYQSGDDQAISDSNRLVRCDLQALPSFEES